MLVSALSEHGLLQRSVARELGGAEVDQHAMVAPAIHEPVGRQLLGLEVDLAEL